MPAPLPCTVLALATVTALIPGPRPAATTSTTPVINTSCAATAFPAPYSDVDACNPDQVACAALSALFTWNPATDTAPEAGYHRAHPMIATPGLQNPDGTPQRPFTPSGGIAGFDTSATAWQDATDQHTALVAYTTRRSQAASRPNTLFNVIQYRYATSAVDDQGSPKPGAIPTSAAWEWWATASTVTDDDGGRRVSYLTQYSPTTQPAADTPAPTPDPATRWSCQRPMA